MKPGERGKAGQQRHVRHRSADVLAAQFGGRNRAQASAGKSRTNRQSQLLEGAGGVDQDVSRSSSGRLKDVHLVQQRRILNDQGIGLHDRFAQADFLVGDAAEGDHRRTGPFRTETREGLGVAPPQKQRSTASRQRSQRPGRRDRECVPGTSGALVRAAPLATAGCCPGDAAVGGRQALPEQTAREGWRSGDRLLQMVMTPLIA
jgi:hypothetical protein